MNIESGQGFQLKIRNKTVYGLVISVKNRQVEFVSVRPILSRDSLGNAIHIKCYDDIDAVYERDKDNVRLCSCPPPFSKIGSYSNYKGEKKSNSYAFANLSEAKHIDLDFLSKMGAEVIDDGVKISQNDMKTVLHHPWESRRQKERVLSDITEFTLDDDVHYYGR